jgi:hypothetical protein
LLPARPAPRACDDAAARRLWSSTAAFEFAAGTAAIVVGGFAAAMLFHPAEPAGRALVMAVVVGVLCVRFTDWRACAGVGGPRPGRIALVP